MNKSIPSFPMPNDDFGGGLKKLQGVGAAHPFRQDWREAVEPEFNPGTVWLAHDGGQLLFYAEMADSSPRNRAVRWNEPTWKLGDVVEFFIGLEGSAAYYELHVTPENQRLQLRFPGPEGIAALQGGKAELDDFMVAESLFESVTWIADGGASWSVFARVPLAGLYSGIELEERPVLRYAVGRYDAQPGRSRPVLSSTAPLAQCDFHRTVEWHRAEVVKGGCPISSCR